MDFELHLNLDTTCQLVRGKRKLLNLTSQFVAVSGTRLNNHPSCDGRSEVRRIYLSMIRITIGVNQAGDILICAHNRVPTKIEPSALHIIVQIWCIEGMCSELWIKLAVMFPSSHILFPCHCVNTYRYAPDPVCVDWWSIVCECTSCHRQADQRLGEPHVFWRVI